MTGQEIKIKAQEWAFMYLAALPNSVRESKWKDAEEDEGGYRGIMDDIMMVMENIIRHME